MLNKTALQTSLTNGIKNILANRNNDTDENGDPNAIINKMAQDIAKVLADAIDTYVKTGSVTVGPANISVTCASPGSPGVVAPLSPANIT